MKVADILRTKPSGQDVVSITADSATKEAARLMAERRIGAVLVKGGSAPGGIAGILSERDVVRGLAERGAAVLDLPAGELMTKEVVTCAPEEAIRDVMEKMTEGRFRHVPVIENGQLAGLISIGDVVKHRLAETEAEVQMMTAYVQS